MSIQFVDVTYIQNGQQITADTLNAPSVDLESRTTEIKRQSDYDLFSSKHAGGCTVSLVAEDPASASITVTSQLRNDGNTPANLIKYFIPALNNISFSLFARNTHGSRYIIPGSDLADIFADGVGDNSVRATALSVPGDGIYAKIPLRFTGDTENLSNYPDEVYPKTRAQSVGTQYLSEAPSATLVKLPEITTMDLVSTTSGENAASFIARVQSEFSDDIGTIQLDSLGALSIEDSNANTLSLRISGTLENARCIVSHVLDREDGEPGVVLRFTRTSAPIYVNHDSRYSVAGLSAVLTKADNTEVSSSAVVSSYDSGYFLLPNTLDPEYAYVPLVKLLDNSIRIADIVIPLMPSTLDNGLAVNIYGDPISGVDPGFSAETTDSYDVAALPAPPRVISLHGDHHISMPEQVTSGTELSGLSFFNSHPVLSRLKRELSIGDTVYIKEASLFVTQSFVSSSQSPSWEIEVALTIDGNTISSIVPLDSAPVAGDTLEVAVAGSLDLASSVSTLELNITAGDGSSQLTSGGLSASLTILVTQ
jgi:hypothetical protein